MSTRTQTLAVVCALVSLLPVAEATGGFQGRLLRLERQLKSSDEMVRLDAADALGEMGERARDAIPNLLFMFEHDEPDLQSSALFAMSKIEFGSASIDEIKQALQSPKPRIRQEAILRLCDWQGNMSLAVALIISHFTDPDPEVRETAVEHILDNLKPEPTVILGPLIRALEDTATEGAAAEKLGQLGKSAAPAVPGLTELLSREPEARGVTAWALGEIGPASSPAVPKLVTLLSVETDYMNRENYCDAIASIGEPNTVAIKVLSSELRDGSGTVRGKAANALGVVASAFEGTVNSMPIAALDDVRVLIQKALVDLKAFAPSESLAIRRVDRASKAIDAASRLRHNRYTLVWTSILSACILVLLVFVFLSVHLRRRLMILLGRRWRFAVGTCDHIVRVQQNADRIRVSAQSTKEADPREIHVDLDAGTRIEAASLKSFSHIFLESEDVRVAVEESLFEFPWSAMIGGRWSGGSEAIVAGQIALVRSGARKKSCYQKQLSAVVLGSGGGVFGQELALVGTELTSISRSRCVSTSLRHSKA